MAFSVQWAISCKVDGHIYTNTQVHLARKAFMTLCGRGIPSHAEVVTALSNCPNCIRVEYGKHTVTRSPVAPATGPTETT